MADYYLQLRTENLNDALYHCLLLCIQISILIFLGNGSKIKQRDGPSYINFVLTVTDFQYALP